MQLRRHSRMVVAGVILSFAAVAGAEETKEATVFEDSFDADKLEAGWSWIREDKGSWRLKDGGLEIRVQPGAAQTVKNALVCNAPDRKTGRYAIEVTVKNHTVPTGQFEQAGITWYLGERPVFKFVKELVNGQLVMVPGRKPMVSESVRLRLVVDAGSWAAMYQPGCEGPFLQAATGKLPAPGEDKVSIQCYHGPPDAEHWIRFDDFKILRLKD